MDNKFADDELLFNNSMGGSATNPNVNLFGNAFSMAPSQGNGGGNAANNMMNPALYSSMSMQGMMAMGSNSMPMMYNAMTSGTSSDDLSGSAIQFPAELMNSPKNPGNAATMGLGGMDPMMQMNPMGMNPMMGGGGMPNLNMYPMQPSVPPNFYMLPPQQQQQYLWQQQQQYIHMMQANMMMNGGNMMMPTQPQPQQPQPHHAAVHTAVQMPMTTWQTTADNPMRKDVITRIVQFLQMQKPNAPQDWMKRLPQMAKKLEEALYRKATSKAEYNDMSTLQARLHVVAQEFKTKTTMANAKPPGEWRSIEDNPVRQELISRIVNLLKAQNPSATAEWIGRLPHMAKKLEDMLYQKATSKAEYTDLNRLKERLQEVATEIHKTNHMQLKEKAAPAPAPPAPPAPKDGSFTDIAKGIASHLSPRTIGEYNQKVMSMMVNLDQNRLVLQRQHMRLMQLRHASECKLPADKCPTPACADMKLLWAHLQQCHKSELCKAPHCLSSKYVLAHYQQCTMPTCVVCRAPGAESTPAAQPPQQPTPTPTPQQPPFAFQNHARGIASTLPEKAVQDYHQKVEFMLNDKTKEHHQSILLRQQQRLMQLRHASECLLERNCPTPACQEMKPLWRHLQTCRQTENCPTAHCLSSKYVLAHFQQCMKPQCAVCQPVRLAQQQQQHAQQQQQQQQAQFQYQQAQYQQHQQMQLHSQQQQQQQQQQQPPAAAAPTQPAAPPAAAPKEEPASGSATSKERIRQFTEKAKAIANMLTAKTTQDYHTKVVGMMQPRNVHQNQTILERQQQRLLHLRHALFCAADKCVAAHCAEMKKLWQHINQCKKSDACAFAHCLSSKYVLSHFQQCANLACVVCELVRNPVEMDKLEADDARGNADAARASATAAPATADAADAKKRPLEAPADADRVVKKPKEEAALSPPLEIGEPAADGLFDCPAELLKDEDGLGGFMADLDDEYDDAGEFGALLMDDTI
ncbi:hypothetical protein ACHHYP_08721 [Achlya hypogyna]|uniref:histone acetyltransferase n=1 Tax=Achlya hypogyna TaxID=1202772 RepID=A0A1V9ZK36_ACHHY|nr:hypothetical protein ACHHYP_08721 [Achlya hypogyna]